jgi:NADP-dependent 3-hydroxy acid dehydrogenase YdfG
MLYNLISTLNHTNQNNENAQDESQKKRRGKIAIVTGSSEGIGKAIAVALRGLANILG